MIYQFNDGWSFLKAQPDSSYDQINPEDACPVQLPHDMLIGYPDHLYDTADGWYFRTLPVTPEMQGNTVLLCFDGVYMDAEVLLDGQIITVHRNGYTAFTVDLTGRLFSPVHEIAVHVRHKSPNSRWYSGAGIYRDVRLLILPPFHLVPDGVRIRTYSQNGRWFLDVDAEAMINLKAFRGQEEAIESIVEKQPARSQAVLLTSDGEKLAWSPMTYASEKEDSESTSGRFRCSLSAPGILPWSAEDPVLYTLQIELFNSPRRNSKAEEAYQLSSDAMTESGCAPVQQVSLNVGFRETRFTPDQGFFLNGKHLKLKGVCLHHDLGALGSAFHEKAAARQLLLMKSMGANAIRTSHNPPASRFLDLCDRLGLLVIDELYDMWELPKTEFDNARFFPQTWKEDVASWIRRDRCHPSVILWSIGNEIPDMHVSERGLFWTEKLMEEVHWHDIWQAAVTFGSNYMPWAGAQHCADVVKITGYNYAEKYYEDHHARHPDWIIYGSETGSLVQSRGIYHFPMKENILSDEDLQCSALLNSKTSWGTQDLARMLCDDRNNPFTLGQFIWSGIDYIGEPTPYHTKNSYFGQADTACFPKDSYYLFQAMWTDTPVIHIGVFWDWNEGQIIDIPVMTNGAFAELFLNGKSLGRKTVDLTNPGRCLNVWTVPYEPGVLEALAYDADGTVLCSARRSSFKDPRRLLLTAASPVLIAGRKDLAFVTVQVVDEDRNPVENAVDRVRILVSGPGRLAGSDNGDSTDTDSFLDSRLAEVDGRICECSSRKLFSGKLLLIIEAGDQEGFIHVEVSSPYLEKASLDLSVISDKETDEMKDCPQSESRPPQHSFASVDSSESNGFRSVDIQSEVLNSVDMISESQQEAGSASAAQLDAGRTAAAQQDAGKAATARQDADRWSAVRQDAVSPLAAQPSAGRESTTIPAEIQEDNTTYAKYSFADMKPEVRRIDLAALSSRNLTPENPSVSFLVRLLPEDAPAQDISFRVLNAKGVDVPGFEIKTGVYSDGKANQEYSGADEMLPCMIPGFRSGRDQIITVSASANGTVYLRASVTNGADHPVILSAIELYAEGFAPTGLDPYHFISSALHDGEEGEITPGNDHGAAFSRDGFSAIGFSGIDFGPEGSDRLILPVFNLDNDPVLISLWEGPPRKGGRLIAELTYHKPSIWNCYQEESWTLPSPLRGVHNLWFSLERKIHLKGFLFEKQSAAFRYHFAADAERIYGDSFRKDGSSVLGIGNNVTLIFEGLHFEKAGKFTVRIDGATPLETQAITIRVRSEDETELVSMCNFSKTGGGQAGESRDFPLSVPEGLCSISFVFLPGSCFDFHGFRLQES